MASQSNNPKVIVCGAGPVGALAALYAAKRGDDVHIYELRDGKCTRCYNPDVYVSSSL